MSLFGNKETVKGKKSLVIYFSRADENYAVGNIEKGNTEVIAEYIQELTGADLFKVEPVKPYSKNYKACCDEALEEKRQNARPELKRYLTDISQYDTIYIGYPIWYGTFPMALASALERLDFTDKTVKPFATNEGSGLGNSVSDIKRLCQNAIVLDGLSIRGSDASISDNLLDSWL